jgi:protease I
MNAIAVVIPEDKFRDEELFVPMAAWKHAGIRTKLFSTVLNEVTGDLGGKAQPEALLEDLSASDFDAIAVIGGSGTASHLWKNARLLTTLRAFDEKHKLVTAICAGAVTLAYAGLLQGIRATTYPADMMITELEKHGATYASEHAITVGNIVTGDGPMGASEYAEAVIQALSARHNVHPA